MYMNGFNGNKKDNVRFIMPFNVQVCMDQEIMAIRHYQEEYGLNIE